MPIEQSYVIKGGGPTGPTILDLNEFGIHDSVGRMIEFREQISQPVTTATAADYIWKCRDGVWMIEYIDVQCAASGGTGCNIDVRVCQGVEAVGSGVAQLTAVLDVEEAAPF